MTRAIRLSLPADAAPSAVYASDSAFANLAGCVHEYVRVLAAIGEPDASIRTLLAETLHDATAPEAPHPAVVAAVLSWADDAMDSQR